MADSRISPPAAEEATAVLDVTWDEDAFGVEIVCFRTGSTAQAATRAVSYIAWGSEFTER